MSISHIHVLSGAVLAACCLFPCAGARAADEPAAGEAAKAEDPAAKEELAYIEALVEANMPDFAAPVIAAAKKRWPALGPKLKVLELQGALRMGKFDEVQKVVDGMKEKNGEYWALRLSMADAYHARGMMPECRKIYEAFFKAVPKPGPDLIDFYVASGFRWAQICVRERKFDEGVRMYVNLLEKIPATGATEERWCNVAMEASSLLIHLAEEIEPEAGGKDAKKLAAKRAAYLDQATKLVDKLLWKNELYVVFGKAIAMKAHVEMLRGNLDGAQNLVNDYMPQLSEIHKSMRELDPDGREGLMRISPMPECRYLLGQVLWGAVQAEMKHAKPDKGKVADLLFGPKQNGKRNGMGAYNHAINVFVNYPEASCAANAGELAESIEKFVKAEYGKTIKTTVTPEQKRKVRKMQFQNAYENYRDGDYAKAVKAYGDILVQFPEVEESVGAVGILAESYLNLWLNERDAAKKLEMRLSANAAEGYLAERFSGLKPAFLRPAGDELLRLAAKENDLGERARADAVYDLFFSNYPTHYNAAQTALSLAGRAYKAEDWERAAHYYGLVGTVFTNSPHRASALQFRATCSAKLGDEAGEVVWLRRFANATTKVGERTTTQLRLALMQQKSGFAAFAAAAETNDAAAAEVVCRAAYGDVAGAIRDFRAVSDAITKELASNKGLSAAEREKFLFRREQAMFLEGDSWQRLTWPKDKLSVFRKQAVKAYERYLAAYPKGTYGAVALVKIGTIHTAEKEMDAAQKAFARLQESFPESDEAKNSVPRLARTLIEMGLREEGVAQYRQMLETKGGKYTAGQFLLAGDALLEAKGWDVAHDAYARAVELAGAMTNAAARASLTARAALGQAKVSEGQKQYAVARQRLEDFIEKHAKSTLVVDAYEMLVEVASIEGSTERDDDVRLRLFNSAVGAIKKLRGLCRNPQSAEGRLELDVLALRSGDVLVRKMEAEEAMNLKEQAEETCRKAIVTFQAFLMAHEPTAENPVDKMSPQQLANLERCYATVLPLMAKVGGEQAEKVREYGKAYLEYADKRIFRNEKYRVAVQNAVNQAKAE